MRGYTGVSSKQTPCRQKMLKPVLGKHGVQDYAWPIYVLKSRNSQFNIWCRYTVVGSFVCGDGKERFIGDALLNSKLNFIKIQSKTAGYNYVVYHNTAKKCTSETMFTWLFLLNIVWLKARITYKYVSTLRSYIQCICRWEILQYSVQYFIRHNYSLYLLYVFIGINCHTAMLIDWA